MEHVIKDLLALAGIIGALTAIGAFVVQVVLFLRKPAEQDKAIEALHNKHDSDMKTMREEDAKRHAETQAELQILCYGLRGALQGLIEKGCNGPCKDALQMLDKHLNKSAHEQ